MNIATVFDICRIERPEHPRSHDLGEADDGISAACAARGSCWPRNLDLAWLASSRFVRDPQAARLADSSFCCDW